METERKKHTYERDTIQIHSETECKRETDRKKGRQTRQRADVQRVSAIDRPTDKRTDTLIMFPNDVSTER